MEEGTTILNAANDIGSGIPHLCFLKDINEIAACRICVVEVEGTERLLPACNNEVLDGMVIHTNSPRVRQARRTNLRLILSQHDSNCTTCIRNGNCSLQKLSGYLNTHYQPYKVQPERTKVDLEVPVVREASKCIKCMRCVQVCDKIQGMKIWDVSGTGSRTTVDVSYNRLLKDVALFDIYTGTGITEGKKSVAFNLTLRADDRNLTAQEADEDIKSILELLKSELNAVLR